MRSHCTISGCTNVLKARRLCSTHYRRWWRHGDPLFVTPRPTHCPQGHPYTGENLYVDRKGAYNCKICQRASGRRYGKSAAGKRAHRRWKEKNPEKFRFIHNRNKIKRRYGITLEEREAMREAQGGVCAICQRTSGNGGLVVDHDHSTGIVRGLLCHNCSLSLGKYEDNPAWLRAAIEYLEHPRTANGVRPLQPIELK